MLVAFALLLMVARAEYYYDKEDGIDEPHYDLYKFTGNVMQLTVPLTTEDGNDNMRMRPTILEDSEDDSDNMRMRPSISEASDDENDDMRLRPTIPEDSEDDSDNMKMRTSIPEASEDDSDNMRMRPSIPEASDDDNDDMRMRPTIPEDSEDDSDNIRMRTSIPEASEDDSDNMRMRPSILEASEDASDNMRMRPSILKAREDDSDNMRIRPSILEASEDDSDNMRMRPSIHEANEDDSGVMRIRSTAAVVSKDDSDVMRKRPTVSLRTLNRQELADIKDALRLLMKNHEGKDMLFTTDETSHVIRTTKPNVIRTTDSDVIRTADWLTVPEHIILTILDNIETTDTDIRETPTRSSSLSTREHKDGFTSPTRNLLTSDVMEWRRIGSGLRSGMENNRTHYESSEAEEANPNLTLTNTVSAYTDNVSDAHELANAQRNETANAKQQTNEPSSPSTTQQSTKSRRRKTRTKKKRTRTKMKFTYSTSLTKSRRKKTRVKTTSSTTTTRATTSQIFLDIPRLMQLITNLTMDYSLNLTDLVNKTLQDVANFSCPTPTTTTELPTTVSTTTADPYGNLTGTIMAKCFVCGIVEPVMPRHARCADAFAGDFIPLVPVEATARKMLASYRKYCRWMNVPKYFINETDPRSMWGRWTGGCSVRWIDISGIYTQRTCRNRHRAVMGNHWASKRMAKLEMAMQRVDNACIISPMASLVPLSRGVSLYARFHVCVCTGSWCNPASPSPPCMLHIVVVTITSLLVMLL